jgi:hypothetical protein
VDACCSRDDDCNEAAGHRCVGGVGASRGFGGIAVSPVEASADLLAKERSCQPVAGTATCFNK